MSTLEDTVTGRESGLRCTECATRLAHDQRYCVECGARRGPLPSEIAQLIGAIYEQGPAPELPAGTPLAESLAERRSRPPGFGVLMPGPRATAFAVIGMLGFGVIVGSLVGGTSVGTLASAPLIIVGLSHPSSSPASSAAGSGAPATITEYVGASSAAAPASSAGSGSPGQTSSSPAATPTTSTGNGGSSSAGLNGLPPVKHVFLIVLSDRGYAQSFGPAASKGYLNGALRRQGELVEDYYAVAASPLANEIALISGQGPTAQTASDCPVFHRIKPAANGARGQVLGTGCVYPASTKTLAGQLTAAGDTWKAYFQDVVTPRTACQVPEVGSQVPQAARSKRSYLAWRNPFVYFRSLTSGSACRGDEAGIGQLADDLKSATTTPSLAYIVPAPCSDGSESPCRGGAKPGLAGANQFLKSVVPEIKHSPAYKDGGLIAVTFDQAPQTGPNADASACCGSPSYPNLRNRPAPAVPPAAMGATTTTGTTGTTTTSATTTTTGTTTTGTTTTSATTTTGTTGTITSATTTTTGTTTSTGTTPSLGSGQTTPTGGGGQVGLLVISPYVKPNTVDVVDYFNHFSLLASIENLFGLHRLGYARGLALPVFGAAVYNNYSG